MAIKIIYTSKVEEKEEPVGKIVMFDRYIQPNPFFPYFYLGERNETLNYTNWPDLVPYLYNKTLGFFTTINNIYQYKNLFNVYSLTASGNIITLKFVDVESVKALTALDEDRKLHFLENNTYTNWNRTITSTSDFTINNYNYLFKDTNYYINDITIISATNANLTIINNVPNLNETLITNKNIEFGLHRIPGNTALERVFYHGLKGKTFAFSDSLDLMPGLRTRSQIMGHAHDHTHTLNNHTHTMAHTHDLSNHTHYMNHRHGFNDIRNGDNKDISPWARNPISNPLLSTNNYAISQITGYIKNRQFTDPPSNNNSGAASVSTTSDASNTNTSNILSKTTDKDDINSNTNNLKIGDKTFSETYTVYAYIYARKYSPNI
jgi:hypothetical protein